MSVHERISRVAHQKWANRLFFWANRLFFLANRSFFWVNHSFFWVNGSFPHFFAKIERLAQKTEERIPALNNCLPFCPFVCPAVHLLSVCPSVCTIVLYVLFVYFSVPLFVHWSSFYLTARLSPIFVHPFSNWMSVYQSVCYLSIRFFLHICPVFVCPSFCLSDKRPSFTHHSNVRRKRRTVIAQIITNSYIFQEKSLFNLFFRS